MKLLIAILFFSYATQASAKLPRERFSYIIKTLRTLFHPYAAKEGRILEFYSDYHSPVSEGMARRWETDQVHVYGGLAGIPNVTEDSFALVLCHELGHLYGGEPYRDSYNRISVEGQADFWGAFECFAQVVDHLEKRAPTQASLSFCQNEEVCARGVDAALVLTAFYADNRNLKHPRLETPDINVVGEVLKVHPAPQCRLDTMSLAFIRGNPPLCWKPNSFPEN